MINAKSCSHSIFATPKLIRHCLFLQSFPVIFCYAPSLVNVFKVLRLWVFFDIFLNVPTSQVGFQILFHHKIHGCLSQVFCDSPPPISVWHLSVLQVHSLLPNIFIQEDCSIMRPVQSYYELSSFLIVLYSDGRAVGL